MQKEPSVLSKQRIVLTSCRPEMPHISYSTQEWLASNGDLVLLVRMLQRATRHKYCRSGYCISIFSHNRAGVYQCTRDHGR